jgi:hypothetical protein
MKDIDKFTDFYLHFPANTEALLAAQFSVVAWFYHENEGDTFL